MLGWGGQRVPFTVGSQRSLYGDAPTAQMRKLVRQDRAGNLSSLISPSTCSCCRLKSVVYRKTGE